MQLLKSCYCILNKASFHVCTSLQAGGLFRARRGLPPSNNEWGPLTDLPDYSIIGKPTPRYTSIGQKRRALQNYLYAKDILRLTKEISTTKARYNSEQLEKDETLSKFRQKCLKTKGNLKQ